MNLPTARTCSTCVLRHDLRGKVNSFFDYFPLPRVLHRLDLSPVSLRDLFLVDCRVVESYGAGSVDEAEYIATIDRVFLRADQG